MPPRSRDLKALRTFAAQHAAAHARVATIRPNAACHCRSRQCAAHADTKVMCTGGVVLILRHDPAVGQLWTVEEVCQACAPLIPHARPMGTAVRPRPATATVTAQPSAQPAAVPAQVRPDVPGGFSAAPLFSAPPGGEESAAPRRSRPPQRGRRPRGRSGGQVR
ncbi:hypothetical protein [Streptomyces sp. NPDC026673]|uniref:hypothetical protein n=1 Tax=Streptomyces sp. NPDC026673 TaxID=3155724 RepID=UPI0033F4F7EC